jgi:hypothetical protein
VPRLSARRTWIAAGAVAAFVAVVALIVLVVKGDDTVSPGPSITASQLRHRLDRTGMPIRYRAGRTGGDVSDVVAGYVPIRRGEGIGFEFVLVDGRRPTNADLGRAGFPLRFFDNGAPRDVQTPSGTVVREQLLRGQVGNVVYADYMNHTSGSDPATQRALFKLDDAFFGTFPPDDAEAHSILQSP